MPKSRLQTSRDHFIQGVSGIANFWGFPKAMGAIYAAVYLSPEPLGLNDLVRQVSVSKGAVSTNVRALQRLQMIHKRLKVGDRKDYYQAETDFWKIVRGVLMQRERSEFDRALRSVGESLKMVDNARVGRSEADLKDFYAKRIGAMKRFFDTLDGIVSALLTLDDLRLGAFQKMFGKAGEKKKE